MAVVGSCDVSKDSASAISRRSFATLLLTIYFIAEKGTFLTIYSCDASAYTKFCTAALAIAERNSTSKFSVCASRFCNTRAVLSDLRLVFTIRGGTSTNEARPSQVCYNLKKVQTRTLSGRAGSDSRVARFPHFRGSTYRLCWCTSLNKDTSRVDAGTTASRLSMAVLKTKKKSA